jgi:hypothetical protein
MSRAWDHRTAKIEANAYDVPERRKVTSVVTVADLDQLYDALFCGVPLPLPRERGEVDDQVDRLYDRVLEDLNGAQRC